MPIIGTSPESIDLAEDRKRFGKLLEELKIPQPRGGTATSVEEALAVGERIGYPVLVRPSYVLGGRAMVIAYDAEAVAQYMRAGGRVLAGAARCSSITSSRTPSRSTSMRSAIRKT